MTERHDRAHWRRAPHSEPAAEGPSASGSAGPAATAPDRSLGEVPLHNARDLGGLRRRSGGATAAGVVYRGESLDRLREADLARLVEVYGVRRVLDLRDPGEVPPEVPARLAAVGLERVAVPLLAALRPANLAGVDPTRPDLARLYSDIVTTPSSGFADALRALLGPGATYVHCAIGKDRTGVVAAVLLELAEVEREEIVADYGASDARIPAVLAAAQGPIFGAPTSPPARAAELPALLRAEPRTIETFLDMIAPEPGSLRSLLRRIGLAPDEVDRLARLLDPTPR